MSVIDVQIGSTTYTCMTSKDGGVEADLTVSVLSSGDGSSVVKPKFEGMHSRGEGGGGGLLHLDFDRNACSAHIPNVSDKKSSHTWQRTFSFP